MEAQRGIRKQMQSLGAAALLVLAACTSTPAVAPGELGASKMVTSKDGTRIAYDVVGAGPALVVIGGALSDRHGGDTLAARLASDFTVYTFDRRGRGDSGDTAPYAVAREVEDIAALIERAGGSAHVFGTSSGAALALQAA